MPEHFADRLTAAVQKRGAPCVVALDPVYENLPPEMLTAGSESEQVALMERYCEQLLDVISPIVPAVKLNSAYFERYHAEGVDAYDRLILRASKLGLVVIGDVKRGDVGHTAEMYARGHLDSGSFVGRTDRGVADAVTISGYFGVDGAAPFMEACRREGRGIFVLVRTSNPSAADIQDIRAADGRTVSEIVAGQVAHWADGEGAIGRCGYSFVGAVTATRDAVHASRLRELMPRSIFLVPGYGAQGGKAADFLPYFNLDGAGAIIAAGRSVIFAYRETANATTSGGDWWRSVEKACRHFVEDVSNALAKKRT